MKSKILLFITVVNGSLTMIAQTIMNIHQSNGTVLSLPLNTIDSITYTIPNPGDLATINSLPIVNITSTSASSGGNIINNGGSPVTQRGVVWSTSPNPTTANNQSIDGNGTGNYASNLIGLTPNTTYYLRSYATNSAGTAYGNELSFNTSSDIGSIITLDCESATITGILFEGITASSVYSSIPYTGGNGGIYNGQTLISNGVTGLTATLNTGTFANGAGSLTLTITGTPATIGTASFFLNIGGQYCTLSLDVNSGSGIITNPGAGVSFDGYTYASILFGNGQEWMAENLRTNTYANGDAIPNVTEMNQWWNLTSGAWAHYNNNIQFENPFGKLYNWYAVNDSRNVCPSGWHVPNSSEWIFLSDYLGGTSTAGGKMKSEGTLYWQNPNSEATNESGFSALPSGSRGDLVADFVSMGQYSEFWSSSFNQEPHVFALTYYEGTLNYYPDGGSPKSGLAIRCLKD